MGEIADAMRTGDSLCGGCGVYLEWANAPGFPLYCSRQCAQSDSDWQVSEAWRLLQIALQRPLTKTEQRYQRQLVEAMGRDLEESKPPENR